GYALIRAHPELQDELVSPVMVSRARQAAENQARGIGYAESPKEELPVLASAIMSNNIRIGFWAFVGGLLLGLPTVLVLVTNGLSLGTGFGVFANYHAGGYLGTFVAGHGVLELTAIFIAGGAGFRLAGAVLLPGDRTRRDALIVEGRVAARLIGAVVPLLAIPGTLAGLLSASDAPAGPEENREHQAPRHQPQRQRLPFESRGEIPRTAQRCPGRAGRLERRHLGGDGVAAGDDNPGDDERQERQGREDAACEVRAEDGPQLVAREAQRISQSGRSAEVRLGHDPHRRPRHEHGAGGAENAVEQRQPGMAPPTAREVEVDVHHGRNALEGERDPQHQSEV